MDSHTGLAQSRGQAIDNEASSPAADVVMSLPERTYRDLGFNRRQTVDPSRVLIVDADFSRCAGIAVLVNIVGRFETRLAYSSGVALAVAADFQPGVVLISTDLPELASYRLAAALHQRSGLFEARLIALTAEITSTDRGQALAAGFEQYLTLPVQHAALERVLMRRSHRGVERAATRSDWGRH
jgi:PleD family two-component response regulator